MIPSPIRKVDMEGAINFRDLGGYRTQAGTTAWGKIYRSDELCDLTPSDVRLLTERGLRTVVDLRAGTEVAARPGAFVGHELVRYHHNPLIVNNDSSATTTAERLLNLDLRAQLIEMATQSTGTFATLFHLLGHDMELATFRQTFVEE
jgi:protein tyrosine/serine phosphatase